MSSKVSLNAAANAVQSVTIFQSLTAEVTRSFAVDLKAGRNDVQIINVSSRIDKESIRIHGLGNGARVFDTFCNIRNEYRSSKNSEAVKGAVSKKTELQAEREIRKEEYEVLNDVARSASREAAIPLDGFMDTFVKRKRSAARAVFELDEQIARLDEEIWGLRNTHTGETAATVFSTILAKRDCQVDLQLTYLVSGVSWQPYYDLHASTSEGKTSSDVTLLYCANVKQNTGEDWTDTVLTLSTANSQALGSLSVPTVDPLKLSEVTEASVYGRRGGAARYSDVAPPPPPAPSVRAAAPAMMRMSMVRKRASASNEDWNDGVLVERDESAEEEEVGGKTTVLDQTAMSLAYRVEGAVTLPSDGHNHKVSVATLDFTAEIKHVCVPRKTAAAFIEGTVKNTSEYELLAGPVSVFMDDRFVTKTALNLISVNERFDCVLGVDTSLKVAYHTRSRTVQEPQRSFAEPTTTTTRTVATTVTNNHSFDVPRLVVRDAIPLGDEDAHIKVMLRRPEGLARAKDGEEVVVGIEGQDVKVGWTKVENGKGGERDGMYEWVCAIPAGKKVGLEAEWDVKSPSNVKWKEGLNNAKD